MPEPYFYHRTEIFLCPFAGNYRVQARKINRIEATAMLAIAEDPDHGNFEDHVWKMEISDNGDGGDGILLSVNSDGPKSEEGPLFWCELSVKGAKAIAEQLQHILKLREIDEEESKMEARKS